MILYQPIVAEEDTQRLRLILQMYGSQAKPMWHCQLVWQNLTTPMAAGPPIAFFLESGGDPTPFVEAARSLTRAFQACRAKGASIERIRELARQVAKAIAELPGGNVLKPQNWDQIAAICRAQEVEYCG